MDAGGEPERRIRHHQHVLRDHGCAAAEHGIQQAIGARVALDPQDVTTVVKDPYDTSGDGNDDNAFRIDIVASSGDVFTTPILFTLLAPTTATGTIDGALTVSTVETPALLTFFQGHVGETLRLRVSQVESTFPWTVQVDDLRIVFGLQ